MYNGNQHNVKQTVNGKLGSPDRSVHTFHIPVMGTGFTIDAPLKVARYGISSVISLVDDVLLEQMRKYHCEREGEPYEAISHRDEDSRARRITAYLNLIERLVERQVRQLQASPFTKGSEITRYYEMLPEGPLKSQWREMIETSDPDLKAKLEEQLRRLAVPGGIDANIMAKLDREVYRGKEKLAPEFSDAMAALRGYANSSLRSSIILSAGFNPRVYGYMAQFEDFFPDADAVLKKKIVLKISDYRSAIIQGKYLAKRGLWVSEYRVESGLNCGGHAFASVGNLMGPILEELREQKEELHQTTHNFYNKALAAQGRPAIQTPLEMRITAQGGIGTTDENELLLKYFKVDATGWATPFLLVPEVTNVDDEHLRKLSRATDDDVFLSDSSPFGIPFWNLRRAASEEARRQRIEENRPGSACPKGFIRLNKELTPIPICTASRQYQKLKLEKLASEEASDPSLAQREAAVVTKSCICHDLAGGATLKYEIDEAAAPAICCGPNIINFSRIASLEEMVGHIYGRLSLLTDPERPHMFIRELKLYVDFLHKEVEQYTRELSSRTPKYFREFRENLLSGIERYRGLGEQFIEEHKTQFLSDLRILKEEIESIPILQPVET